jgi:hypothetical protein
MSCALTQDLNLDCKDSVGGLKEAYAIELENITSITETAGVVSALAKVAAKQFRRYKLVRETCNAESPITSNPANGSTFSTHTLKLIFNKLQTSVRNEVLLMAKNRLVFVVLDNNGKYWMLGRENGLDLTTGANSTGTASGDRSGYELDFSGTEREPMIEVSSTVAATLTTPGA